MKLAATYEISDTVFFGSLFTSMIILICLFPCRETVPLIKELAEMTRYFGWAQLLAFVAIVPIFWYWHNSLYPKNRRRTIIAVALFVSSIVIILRLETMFIGNSFASDILCLEKSDTLPLEEPPLAVVLMHFFGEKHELPGSAPSDFVLRQWSILLIALTLISLPSFRVPLKVKFGLVTLFSFSFLYVASARIFRLANTPIEVGIAVGFGAFLYWTAVLALATIKGLRGFERFHPSFVAYSVLFLILLLLVSKNPTSSWMWWFIVTLPLVAVAFGRIVGIGRRCRCGKLGST